MADDLDLQQQVTGRLIVPYTVTIPDSQWTMVRVRRKAIIRFPKTTLYNIYFIPGTSPPPGGILSIAHLSTTNDISLYGRGEWMIYQASGGAITGLLMDAAAGDLGLELTGTPPTASLIDSLLASPLTEASRGAVASSTAGVTIVAANTSRRALYLRNLSTTAAEIVTIGFGATPTAGQGVILLPGSSGAGEPVAWSVLDRVPTGTVVARSASGTPSVSFAEYT